MLKLYPAGETQTLELFGAPGVFVDVVTPNRTQGNKLREHLEVIGESTGRAAELARQFLPTYVQRVHGEIKPEVVFNDSPVPEETLDLITPITLNLWRTLEQLVIVTEENRKN